MRAIFLVLLINFLISAPGKTQINLAREMANTVMLQYKDSMVVKKYINHLMQDNQISKGETDIEKANQRPAQWGYEIGVVLMGIERLWLSTGDPAYLQYIKKIMDRFITPEGDILTYHEDEFNIDNIPPGRQLLTLYYTYKDSKYLKAAERLKHQLDWQPTTKSGGYWHKLKYPYQMWLDGLYMGQPFRAEYNILTRNDSEWDDLVHQFVLMEEGSRDSRTGLLYHAFDESRVQRWSDPSTGMSPNFWSRSMGWFFVALVDVLDHIPAQHPGRKKLTDIIERLTKALVNHQDPASGTWWQVTDMPGRAGNYLESSGTAMFTFSMLKSIRMGYISDSYLPAARKAYDGMIKEFVTKDKDGVYHYIQAVSGAGLGGSPYRDGSYEYYVNEPKRDDDLKAIGPFIQACLEYDLLTNSYAKGKKVLLDNHFNNELDKNGLPYHYIWEDRFDSGYSWLGHMVTKTGATKATLHTGPTAQNLKGANVYIIVDPDTHKESKTPKMISEFDIQVIAEWVRDGGSLLLLTNDTTNAEIKHSNALAKVFGIEFTGKNIHFVKNDHYPDGTVEHKGGTVLFPQPRKLYIKELVTLKLKKPAIAEIRKGKDILMASSRYGKGKVIVLGDPWIYNEYVNGRKLPADYQNYEAAEDVLRFLLQ